jgi:hypothetical protein
MTTTISDNHYSEPLRFPRFEMYEYIIDIWFDTQAIHSGAFTYRFFETSLEKVENVISEFLCVLDTGGALMSYGMKDNCVHHMECSSPQSLDILFQNYPFLHRKIKVD